jgi:hypothetical protein
MTMDGWTGFVIQCPFSWTVEIPQLPEINPRVR